MPATKKRLPKLKKKAPRTRVKPTGRNPVKPTELARATRMAQSKKGVTKRQLAKALRISEARANTILTRIPKIKSAPMGPDAGKACRTLVFSLKAKKKK